MVSKDQSTQQNYISDEEAPIEVIEKDDEVTSLIDGKESAHLIEQDLPTTLSDEELSMIAGSGDLVSIAKITNKEFVRSGVAGITGLAGGITSFSAVNAINKGKNPKKNL